MSEKPNLQNKPKVQYRVEMEKKIDINKSYSQRRNQAIALRILSYGLFGQKRYQNLYLTCSLNCFYYALKIANVIHRRVPGLAMIIKFETAHVIEYYEEPFEGKTYGEKKYSKINIKLTKNPSEQDKNQPGFNAGLDAKDIEQPLTDVIARKQRPEGLRRGGGRFQRRYNRGGFNRGGYRNRGGFRRPPYNNNRYYNRYDNNREQRDNRQGTNTTVDYRKFRSNKNEQPEQDNQRRGERRTRGSYQSGSTGGYRSYERNTQGGYERRQGGYDRRDQQRSFIDRRVRNQQSYRNERENRQNRERGARGPQRGYRGDSDQ